MENLDLLIKELCKQPNESGWVEFKHNNCSPEMIGENISALANSAVLADRSYAYMIWGVDDTTHQIIGTTIRLKSEKKGNQELENWLRYMLSKNANFEFQEVEIDGKHVELIVIAKAEGLPVTFEKIDYIRSGSYTKKLIEFPSLQTQLWDKLRHNQFEDTYTMTGLTDKKVLRLLNYEAYFSLLHIPLPDETEQIIHYLKQEEFLVQQDDGLYAITNLGAILLAKNLSDFSRLARKAIRVVQYNKNNREIILKEEIFNEGYATSLEKAIKYVNTLLPSKENPNEIQLCTISTFPFPAIRESIANSLIHQDFYIKGAGPVVELFENRVEVTNPGVPLVDVMRIIDNPPKSRNEKLASMMRRMRMCEELGRGWDRMVISCEAMYLPAPRINVYQESTRVSLFSYIDFVNIQTDDRIWSTYLHSCIKYIEGEAMSNSSLRERFGLKTSSSGMVSRLIKEVQGKNLIKPVDPETAPRYMRYIPIWA
ncbi:ATP-binding protein [Capnocytophaga leadbetteri]|uniref:ATP-binding protein n=1 Tax=Capnocytophaga leadbetteri TaxID=327575 RepID=UPI0028D816A9|nr:ATP-binding protein [Capnocytophaga leadbetteri]